MIPILATLVVLMYHRVAPDVPKTAVGLQLTVKPAAFAAQLDRLARNRIRVYTADEAAQRIARGERLDGVVLTFDDGRIDNYEVAYPMLRRHGMHASFYVNSSTIDAAFHMTWRDLRTMRAAGNEVGCHGHEHVDLATLTPAQQQYQIGHCLDMVQQHVGQRPRTYAYASGKYDATTRAMIQKHGLEAAMTEIPGMVKPGVDSTQWPRLRVDRDTSLESFSAMVAPAIGRSQPAELGSSRAVRLHN